MVQKSRQNVGMGPAKLFWFGGFACIQHVRVEIGLQIEIKGQAFRTLDDRGSDIPFLDRDLKKKLISILIGQAIQQTIVYDGTPYRIQLFPTKLVSSQYGEKDTGRLLNEQSDPFIRAMTERCYVGLRGFAPQRFIAIQNNGAAKLWFCPKSGANINSKKGRQSLEEFIGLQHVHANEFRIIGSLKPFSHANR